MGDMREGVTDSLRNGILLKRVSVTLDRFFLGSRDENSSFGRAMPPAHDALKPGGKIPALACPPKLSAGDVYG